MRAQGLAREKFTIGSQSLRNGGIRCNDKTHSNPYGITFKVATLSVQRSCHSWKQQQKASFESSVVQPSNSI
jgi:hypothetical protein